MRRYKLIFVLVAIALLLSAMQAAAAPATPPAPQPGDDTFVGPVQKAPKQPWQIAQPPCPAKKGYLPARTQTGKCIYFMVRSDGALSLDGKNWMVPGPNSR